ncbi:MAG: hypothetical protein M3322_07830 [Actinomycetota bacterium]|nr:hypothetical protein [Actinomycetota bacterium]
MKRRAEGGIDGSAPASDGVAVPGRMNSKPRRAQYQRPVFRAYMSRIANGVNGQEEACD